MRRAVVYSDGGCRENPHGPYACAAVLQFDETKVRESRYLGDQGSNNEAEYGGIILALEMALRADVTHLTIRSDSRLVVEQLLGNWRVKTPHLRALRERAITLSTRFESVEIDHVGREKNEEADALCTEVLDRATGRARSPKPAKNRL